MTKRTPMQITVGPVPSRDNQPGVSCVPTVPNAVDSGAKGEIAWAITEDLRDKNQNMKCHPFAKVFPLLPEKDLNLLATNIKDRGLLDPIVKYEGSSDAARTRFNAVIPIIAPKTRKMSEPGERNTPGGGKWIRIEPSDCSTFALLPLGGGGGPVSSVMDRMN